MIGPSSSLTSQGVPETSDLGAAWPSPARLASGPVAIIECLQPIPCDPCADACRRGAVLPFEQICDLPRIDHDRCNGCAQCVVRCPGLAIFVLDLSLPGVDGTIKLPYEYLPLPRAGDQVWALDRRGRAVCPGKVTAVRRPAAFDRTALVTVEAPKQHLPDIRAIGLLSRQAPFAPAGLEPDKDGGQHG